MHIRSIDWKESVRERAVFRGRNMREKKWCKNRIFMNGSRWNAIICHYWFILNWSSGLQCYWIILEYVDCHSRRTQLLLKCYDVASLECHFYEKKKQFEQKLSSKDIYRRVWAHFRRMETVSWKCVVIRITKLTFEPIFFCYRFFFYDFVSSFIDIIFISDRALNCQVIQRTKRIAFISSFDQSAQIIGKSFGCIFSSIPSNNVNEQMQSGTCSLSAHQNMIVYSIFIFTNTDHVHRNAFVWMNTNTWYISNVKLSPFPGNFHNPKCHIEIDCYRIAFGAWSIIYIYIYTFIYSYYYYYYEQTVHKTLDVEETERREKRQKVGGTWRGWWS